MYKKIYFMVIILGTIFLIGCGNARAIVDEKAKYIGKDFETVVFTDEYRDNVEKVNFDMKIVIDTDIQKNLPVTAKAHLQKVNKEKAFDLLYRNVEEYDVYEYDEKDEYKNIVKMGTYVSPEGLSLTYGSYSSHISYVNPEITPYIYAAFVLDETDSAYNADLYSCETQLPFGSREDAFALVEQTLNEIGIHMDNEYQGYALDYQTMKEQEWHMDIDGNRDSTSYKENWSEEDDCYYFAIHQMYKGLPLYHPYSGAFINASPANAPVIALVSDKGIQQIDVEMVFDMTEENEKIQLQPIENVVAVIAEKYNQILGDSQYEMQTARLYYYVDLNSGVGTYDVKPVWIVKGIEKVRGEEKELQIIVDAQTAKEIIP